MTMRLSRPRLLAYGLLAGLFAGVWLAAREPGALVLVGVLSFPLQYFSCRAVLAERGYSPRFAWFSLLLGPMGILIVLGFPELPSGAGRDQSTKRGERGETEGPPRP
jgi:hypothetical protein